MSAAAQLMAQFLSLNPEGKAEFERLLGEWNRPRVASWAMPQNFLPAPVPVRSDPPLMVNVARSAMISDHEDDDDDQELEKDHQSSQEEEEEPSEEPLNERCFNVCEPRRGVTCACRYKLTDTETKPPAEFDLCTVAVFFPEKKYAVNEKDHPDLSRAKLEKAVSFWIGNKNMRTIVTKLHAVPGYKKGRNGFVTSYVLVHCGTHEKAVHIYTLLRNTLAQLTDKSFSINWGRKRKE